LSSRGGGAGGGSNVDEDDVATHEIVTFRVRPGQLVIVPIAITLVIVPIAITLTAGCGRESGRRLEPPQRRHPVDEATRVRDLNRTHDYLP
jgi:hypothetical protein